MKSVVVLGRFPPPIDGQSILTERVADILEPHVSISRINVSPPDTGLARSAAKLSTVRALHYLRSSLRIRRALGNRPDADVLWASISPSPLGHFRDRIAISPAFGRGHRVWGVVHWGNFDRVFQSTLTRSSALKLADRLTGFVFLDPILGDRCAAWLPEEKRIVIPNTIDDRIYFTRDEIEIKHVEFLDRAHLKVLFLSNMTRSKGYLDVLHAMALLHQDGLPIKAEFVGRWESDADARDFERMVDRLGIRNCVLHLGGISDRARVKQLHAAAHVFVLPTYYPTEAQPVSLIEALNAATPVIATRHASIPSMMNDDQEGLFVPANDPGAIAAALRRMMPTATWLRYSGAARARFESQFSREVVLRKWLALLT